MNPLLAVGIGWLVLRAMSDGNKGGSVSKQAPRVIDASGPGIKLLPAPAKPKPKAPTGTVTPGTPTQIKPAAKAPAKPVAPAPTRSTAQAAQPAKKTAATPQPTAKQAQATAAARASMPAAPTAAVKVPAPPGTDLPKAKRMAAQVATNVKKGINLYDRKLVKAFQTACGLTSDGLYGPVCASALSYFGVVAPKPLFKGQDLKYVPPGG